MCHRRKLRSVLLTGSLLVLVGTLLLLQNFEIINGYLLWKFWPLALVAVGAVQLALSIGTEDFPDGLWTAFTGAWLYVSLQHVWGLSFGETWPMWLVAWGVAIIWKSFFKNRLAGENKNG